MMVSSEWYAEECLKGKTTEQIQKEICSLKRKIGRLKKVVENPQEYMEEWGLCPDPQVRLEMHRLYLQKAIEALTVAQNRLADDKL